MVSGIDEGLLKSIRRTMLYNWTSKPNMGKVKGLFNKVSNNYLQKNAHRKHVLSSVYPAKWYYDETFALT